MSSSLPPLSDAQLEIMELIWEHGELSVSQALDLVRRRRPVARNTVRTLLERMEEKGWLIHREVERSFVYAAARPKRETLGSKVVELVDQFCDGSAASLVNALLDYRGVTPAELRRIRELLDQAHGKAGKAKPDRRS